jgi:hypothetical protein
MTNPADLELNEKFAEHVAQWEIRRLSNGTHERMHRYENCARWRPCVLNFTESLDASVPFLEQRGIGSFALDYEPRVPPATRYRCNLRRYGVEVSDASPARAVVRASLLVAGVLVEL